MVRKVILGSSLICWLVVAWLVPAGLVSAAGSKRTAQPSATKAEAEVGSLYDQAVSAAGEQQYRRAIDLLRQAVALQPDDADAHNLLGYCLRKNGDIEGAFASYAEALRLRPRFPEAREYLAEAHLQAALEELGVLRSYGSEAATMADRLKEAFNAAAGTADAAAQASRPDEPRDW